MWQKSLVTLDPKTHPAPLALMAQSSMSSGSDHMRSQKGPSWGISIFLSIVLIWSMVFISGLSPPWTQKTFPGLIKSYHRWQLRWAGSQRLQCNISKDWGCRISCWFHHRIRKQSWFVYLNKYVPGFVVSSEESDSIWVFDLEAEEVFECFYGVISSIHEVSDKDVASLVNLSSCIGFWLPVLKSSKTS